MAVDKTNKTSAIVEITFSMGKTDSEQPKSKWYSVLELLCRNTDMEKH